MAHALAYIVLIYLIILAARAVLSWFPVRGGTFLASVNTLLFELTEPVLRPVRRVIPPVGMFDVSFMVVFFFLFFLFIRSLPMISIFEVRTLLPEAEVTEGVER